MYWFLKFCERELWDPTLKLLAELAEQPGAELVKTNRHNWRHSRRRPCSRLSQFKRYMERMRPTGAGNIHFPLLSICTYCRMSGEFVRKGQDFKTMAVFAIIAIKADVLCLSYHITDPLLLLMWSGTDLWAESSRAGRGWPAISHWSVKDYWNWGLCLCSIFGDIEL